MKIRKLQTLNEAVAKISDTDQGMVGIVFADAIRETAAKKDKIEKAMVDRKIEMPNEDRFAHKKINSTKEMKKMKLAESLFTEWFDADEEKETFVQPNLILEEGQYQFDDETGNITVNKAIFDDYMEGKRLNIKFVDDNGEDVFCYKMISENDDSITMEYVGDPIPGIDEEIADCQKYPIEKPEAKDSEFISADDKQPKDKVEAKDTGFVSAEDKQPNKAAMKESVEKKAYEYIPKEIFDKITIEDARHIKDWIQSKPNITNGALLAARRSGYSFPVDENALKLAKEWLNKKPTLVDELKTIKVGDRNFGNYYSDYIELADYIEKRDSELKESFNNWDSPESRIERYETDLPELMYTIHDAYMNGRIEAEAYAQALKVAYDALDSVPSMDEALEDSQRYPIEKPKAKDSQFISKEDKQPKATVDAKDSQFVSAGDKDVEKAFGEKKLGESLEQP